MTREEIYAAINEERARQDKKYPVFANSEHQALAVLASEFGEVSTEVRGSGGEQSVTEPMSRALRAELIQVAAVCVRWLEQAP